jgi:hypothetical protein
MQKSAIGTGGASTAGGGDHIVAPGECIMSIAAEAGLFWQTVWNHPQNASLKDARGTPNQLIAGDRVHVPPLELRLEDAATEQRHKYKKKGVPIDVEFELREQDKPLKGVRYILTIEGRTQEGHVPDDGIVRAKMYPTDRAGVLRVGMAPREKVYPLEFGHLDPADTPSGAIERLKHLGYLSGDDGEEEFKPALRAFQGEEGLNATGELDRKTADKLAHVHGS